MELTDRPRPIEISTMNSNGSATHADVLVLGFGKAGKTAATRLARLGRRVVLVEQSERMYGGTCPNVGCVPSKGMVHHSGLRRPEDPPQEFYARAVEEVQAVRELMRAGNRDAMDAMESVELITGHASFVDPHTVRVDVDGEPRMITADTILLNTGSEPGIPDIPGLRGSSRAMDSTRLLESRVLPERLVILGTGAIGIELGQVYRHFGSAVTLLGSRPRILPEQDEDVAATAHAILVGDGLRIETGARVTQVRDAASAAVVVYEQDGAEQTVEADAVLVAAGRTAATRGLGLDVAGVRTTDAGDVVVDDQLRTSQPHIYALGDVNGGPHHTYISLDDSRIVMDQLAGEGRRSRADRVAIPQTLFMTPPLATVGLTEHEARDAGHRFVIAGERVADIIAMPRAHAVQETRGMMKFVIDADTDLILGAALLSIDAQEVINTVALAMRHGITATELRDSVYTHPSTTEAFNEVLGTIARAEPAAQERATVDGRS
jgi:pyruvate/2-oxoglutarate dehydrogenase complex dihydrolipoamide dehydrogenase (E3) component